jgi:peptidylprolyl isomerase
MTKVKDGDTIRIHYVGKFEDGTVFESTEGKTSMEVKLGSGEFLKEFEEGVLGMSPGQKKTLKMDQPYGPRDEERVFEFDRNKLPPNLDTAIGQQIEMHRADGRPVTVTVVGKSETSVTLDGNHPLAGKNLIFDITLEEIVQKDS